MELTRGHFRIMIYYDFKKGLSAYEGTGGLDSIFSEQAPSLATIYRWYKEFERERNSVQHQKGAGCPPTAVTDKNIAVVKKIIEEDNKATYAVIEHQFKIGSSAVRTIMHDHPHLKKAVSRFVSHHLSDFQKATYIPFFDVSTHQESRVWIHEDEETPIMTKKQRAVKKVMYAVFFRSTSLVKAIKLDGQKTVTAKWYTEKCLPEVFNRVPDKNYDAP